MNKKFTLGVSEEYLQQTKEYGKIDVISAIGLYATLTSLYYILGKIFVYKGQNLTEKFVFIATGIMSLVCIILVSVVCLIRKQNINSIGFHKTNAKRSFIMGLVLSLIAFVLLWILKKFTGTVRNQDVTLLISRVIYYLLFVSLMEEVIFRGYIGTRLYGFFHNKKLSIFLVGVLFSLSHVPFQMLLAQVSFFSYIGSNCGDLFVILLFHVAFQWMYSRYNSIIAPMMVHFLWDFAQWFFIV